MRRLSSLSGLAALVVVSVVGAAYAQSVPQAKEARAAFAGEGRPTLLPTITERVTLIADRDDDDVDGRPDAEGDVAPLARVDLVAIDPKYVGGSFTAASGVEKARIIANGKALAWGEKIPAGAQLQGVAPGRTLVNARTARGQEIGLALDIHGIAARDGKKTAVEFTRDHASLQRTPPARIDLDDADRPYDDPDALRITVASPPGSSIGVVNVESVSADGTSLDTLKDVKLAQVACAEGLVCSASAPLRFVVDDVDRAHALVVSRSLRAEVGGAVVVRDGSGKKLQALRVKGPRATAVGPMGRQRLSIRAVVMRLAPGSTPSIGGTDAGAAASIKQELAAAAATWGQCGFSFGPSSQMDVKVASPPPPYLVAIGDDIGLPASGGNVKLKIEGKPISVTTKKGWSTRQVALELQRVAEGAGFKASLSENARIAPGATPSVDVIVRKNDNQLASVELVASSDATLSVHIGSVDLTDGLQHFGDVDSVAGTLEERTLVKAVDDGDPHTIEVIVVPFFAGGGRIGESFITSDGSSMRNVVIIDRAGVRARRTSLTLAHELGHVILDEPGHPDDYGIDTPTLLMDSDASDASPFGPRRITTEECAKAVRQSGPTARVPLLSEWKLAPLKYSR